MLESFLYLCWLCFVMLGMVSVLVPFMFFRCDVLTYGVTIIILLYIIYYTYTIIYYYTYTIIIYLISYLILYSSFPSLLLIYPHPPFLSHLLFFSFSSLISLLLFLYTHLIQSIRVGIWISLFILFPT